MKNSPKHNQGLGRVAAVVGSLIALAGIVALLLIVALYDYLPPDWQALIPVARSTLVTVLSLIGVAIGIYCIAWGTSLIAQMPWGIYGAGLSLGLMLIYVLAAAYLWYARWATVFAPSAAEIGNFRLYGLAIAGLLVVGLSLTIYRLWFSPGLEAYATNYSYAKVRQLPQICPHHKLILVEGRCVECMNQQACIELFLPEDPDHPRSIAFAAEKPQMLIGRGPTNDIVLDQAIYPGYVSVSSTHAELRYDFERHYLVVIDKNSTNGTSVNGQPLTPGKFSQPVTDEATLQLGDVEIWVRIIPFQSE